MKKLTLFKAMFLTAVVLFGSMSVFGQTEIVKWSFAAMPGGSGNYGISPLDPATQDENLTVGALTRHWTPSGGTGAGSAWGGNNFTATSFAAAVTANEFVTFTLSANTDYTLSLASIGAYNVRRAATGPTTGQWQYVVGAGEFTNLGAAITWGSVTSTAGNPQTAIDLSGISELQGIVAGTVVTFRLVVWGATGTAGTFYFNDHSQSGVPGLPIFGTVAAVGAPEQVATPQFTPSIAAVGGIHFDPFTVTITSDTDGAVIYYTTDGSEPTTSSPSYSTEIPVSATTTIKAIGVKDGMTNSIVASATYTFPTEVADIAEFIALPEGTVAKITGTLTVVTQQQTTNLFVQDESGWLVIYGNSGKTYQSGDQLTGVIGKFLMFGTPAYPELELISEIELPNGVAGEPAVPAVVAPENLTNADLNRYVSFKNVEIAENITFTTTDREPNGTIVTDDEAMIIRNHYNLINTSFAAGDMVNLTGIVRTINSTIGIYLLSIENAGNVNINDTQADATKVYVTNGNVIIVSEQVQLVEIFNITGQKLVTKNIAEGTNNIPVNSGIVFVTIGGEVIKVVVP